MRETEELEKLMTLKDVKDVLGISYGVILAHIRDGKLKAHKVTGQTIAKQDVGNGTLGMRIKPSDLRGYLTNTLIK